VLTCFYYLCPLCALVNIRRRFIGDHRRIVPIGERHEAQRPTLHLFADRILDQKKRLEAQVAKLQPGPEREQLLMKLRELDAASDIDEWLSPPGSQAK
jgi:hypothetical protein